MAVLLGGVVGSVLVLRQGRAAERDRAWAEFARRTSVRHTLTREVLGRYEDSLFGLSTLFMRDSNVSRAEFMRATARLEERLGGAQAFEWVPAVPHAQRAEFETGLNRLYPHRGVGLIEFDAEGVARTAANRAEYYPITYIQPLTGNERVVGFDLKTGATRAFLEQARATRQMVVTRQVELVRDPPGRGVALIWPVYRSGPSGQDEFGGFLQCVFRLPEFLEAACGRQSDTTVEMMFIDASEPDRRRRLLYHRAAVSAGKPPPTEEDFRRGTIEERGIAIGGRNWRVLYRPRRGWLEEQYTHAPLFRAAGLLALSGLLAALVRTVGRRAETIRRQVAQRTAELAESRRELAHLLQAMPGMAYRCRHDDELTVLYVSEGVRELTGCAPEEFTRGKRRFQDLVHPDDIQRVRKASDVAMQQRAAFETEFRVRRPDGTERWVLSRGRGLYSANGELNAIEGLAIDITAQKRSEEGRLALERKLLEGQKLESLGLLAGGIAHDFNNLLSGILGNATLVRMNQAPGSQADGQLQAIEETTMRAAELCRQMLAYAGKGRFVVEPTDITRLAEELLPLLKISVARQGTLEMKLDRNLPAVLADATQLRQIIMNLVLNAAEAIPPERRATGKITLTTAMTRADAALLSGCAAGANLPPGEYVSLEVCDNGCGMPPDLVAKIFDPFFTTKFAGRGLGLAAVLGIVRGHNGALKVESTPGAGSSFRLLLPPAGCAPARRIVDAPPADEWTSAASVLVVEDEDLVRAVLLDTLKTFGLKTRSAADGTEAITVFRNDPTAFDLVVLDLLMPGISGEQALQALRESRPDVRVLLISGYNPGDTLRQMAGEGRLDFLAKPFTRRSLEQKLREMLS